MTAVTDRRAALYGTADIERGQVRRRAERLYASPYAPPVATRDAARVLGRPVPDNGSVALFAALALLSRELGATEVPE